MILIPTSLKDWNSLHYNAQGRSGGYERALLNVIFDDSFLINTIEILFHAPDPLSPEIREPTEKFLAVVNSKALQNRTIDLCFEAETETQKSAVCRVLIKIADKGIWSKLELFSASADDTLQRTGAQIVTNLIEGGFVTAAEAEQMLPRFEPLQDSHVRELVAACHEAMATTGRAQDIEDL
jgi:hypothetical protein